MWRCGTGVLLDGRSVPRWLTPNGYTLLANQIADAGYRDTKES